MWGELALSFQSGNVYMLIIMAVAALATLLIFERFIMLQFVYNLEFTKFTNNIKKMIVSKDIERAINFCRSVSKTSLPKIALRALEASENDPSSVRGTLEEHTIDFLPRVECRIHLLPALATLVMLVGILGTIDGLWQAFHSIDVLDTAKKQASLATGIAGSLNPTAMGLTSSMLILCCHHLLKSLALGIVDRIHVGVAVLSNLLVPHDVAATFVPIAAQTAGSLPPIETKSHQEAPTPDEGMPPDDAFDDAAVEDIKDEEEII